MSRYDAFTWYKCTNVKPPCDGEYIVTCRNASRATTATFENGKWLNNMNVVAWTFFPGIYREGEN